VDRNLQWQRAVFLRPLLQAIFVHDDFDFRVRLYDFIFSPQLLWTCLQQEAKLSLGQPTVLPHSTFLRSRDVIGHVTIWQPICHFLLVVLLEPSLYL